MWLIFLLIAGFCYHEYQWRRCANDLRKRLQDRDGQIDKLLTDMERVRATRLI